jgi:hypothetical protein
MNTDHSPLHRLLHAARIAVDPNVPAPPSLSTLILANLRAISSPEPQHLQRTLACSIALAASVTLLLLFAPEPLASLIPLTEPESFAPLLLDLADL